jgi:hypothetical protein
VKHSPRPEVGQHWQNTKHDKAVRRIADASDPWTVMMENITTGRRTKVIRVSEWGRPNEYVFVPKSPEAATKEEATQDDVHIRFSPGEGPRLTYCMKPVDELMTTTLDNLKFWRKRRTICRTCDRRRQDGKAALGEISGAA